MVDAAGVVVRPTGREVALAASEVVGVAAEAAADADGVDDAEAASGASPVQDVSSVATATSAAVRTRASVRMQLTTLGPPGLRYELR
ncbi:MAG: hypothetical protein ACR2HP_05670 [Ilumatobacteraceae bacterium]